MANSLLADWIRAVAAHTTPVHVAILTGTDDEKKMLRDLMLADGSLLPLDTQEFPESYLYRSAKTDVARVESRTFIVADSAEDVGPNNNHMTPASAASDVWPLFGGSMKGKTMYVVPYCLGPIDAPRVKLGVEITDSPYVALSLMKMYRVSAAVLDKIDRGAPFARAMHSVGTLDPRKLFIVHFPKTGEIWSINSNYGGNALLPKKCHALRLCSTEARDEGWLAEHMAVLGVTQPSGEKTWLGAAFPSGCGKTNIAMLVPSLPGYEIETLSEDLVHLFPNGDGGLSGINPEYGMFGILKDTSRATNPVALRMLNRDVIFTNAALAPNHTVWWEGKTKVPPQGLVAWDGTPWDPSQGRSAAHGNSRFTVEASNCETVGETFNAPDGAAMSAILFGGRRAKAAPLVYESFGWEHGVYVGATMVSETTAAATGAVGVPRNDPMAMLPFCGYHMGDYFDHWLKIGASLANPPRIFHVNWFRTDDDGKLLWPGFGENVRVLQWIIDRCNGRADAVRTPIGFVPTPASINFEGLNLSPLHVDKLLSVDSAEWLKEAALNEVHLSKFADRLPAALRRQHDALLRRLRLPL